MDLQKNKWLYLKRMVKNYQDCPSDKRIKKKLFSEMVNTFIGMYKPLKLPNSRVKAFLFSESKYKVERTATD